MACNFSHLLDVGLLPSSHPFVHLVDLLFMHLVPLSKFLFTCLVPLSEMLAMRLFPVNELIVQTCQCISMCLGDVGMCLGVMEPNLVDLSCMIVT